MTLCLRESGGSAPKSVGLGGTRGAELAGGT